MAGPIKLKRLLVWVAKKTAILPSEPKKLADRLNKTAVALGLSYRTNSDNIRKYIQGRPDRPGNPDDASSLLRLINFLLYENKSDLYLKDFDTPASQIKDWDNFARVVDDYFRDTVRPRIDGVRVAPDYTAVDPTNIKAFVTGRPENVMDSHLLYHSALAAEIWERIKNADEYPLYQLCEDRLKVLLDRAIWKTKIRDAKIIFNLGAGGASKDKLILRSLSKQSVSYLFVWVEASWPMLHKTIKDLEPDLREYTNVSYWAALTDFVQAARFRSLYENSIAIPEGLPHFDERKIFLVLGFTLSNIHEESFFRRYRDICSPGDAIVFPMQFIPKSINLASDAEFAKYRKTIASHYDFPDGRRLAKAGLSNLPDRFMFVTPGEPEVRQAHFNGKFTSVHVEYSVTVEDTKDNLKSNVTTARSSRHQRDNYQAFLQKYGFKIVDETPEKEGVCCVMVERMKDDG